MTSYSLELWQSTNVSISPSEIVLEARDFDSDDDALMRCLKLADDHILQTFKQRCVWGRTYDKSCIGGITDGRLEDGSVWFDAVSLILAPDCPKCQVGKLTYEGESGYVCPRCDFNEATDWGAYITTGCPIPLQV